MIKKIQFNRNFSCLVYKKLALSKSITGTYRIKNGVLYISSNDFEVVDRIFNSLILKYKCI